MIPTINIATPCYNAGRYIEETMYSVINNTLLKQGKARLNYIIADGASNDDTVAIVDDIIARERGDHVNIELISKPDQGMYDALAKAFAKMNAGDVYGYINAGDLYSPHAFEIVNALFGAGSIQWVTGYRVVYNIHSHIVQFDSVPRYRRRLIQIGAYGSRLPVIQQESTFWSGKLHRVLDLAGLARCKLAGDYYLWKQFSENEELYVVQAWLGGYKKHDNNLSADRAGYLQEMARIADRPGILDKITIALERQTLRRRIGFRRSTLRNYPQYLCYNQREDKYGRIP